MTEPSVGFLRDLRERARARQRVLVFPEATEPRVHAALADALPNGLFRALLLGPPAEVRDGLAAAGVASDLLEIIDPDDPIHRQRCTQKLSEIRLSRGSSPDGVEELARDPLMQAALLVRLGEADGAIAGAVRTTAAVVRAALTGLGLAQGSDTLSSSFFMVFEPDHRAGPSVLTFTDPAVVPTPTAEQLAQIASAAAVAHATVVGEEPRVAFLSYSTKGSADGPSVTLARDALARFRDLMPDVPADGELQGDAALDPSVGDLKAPGSPVAGRANVLVFPDLAAANIAYKLVHHLGGARALGPVLQGLAKPFNDLSRGATPGDITAVACITSLMAD